MRNFSSGTGPRFVLVEPLYPGNAGSAARALKNLGFSRLSLVRPRYGIDDPKAIRLAVDAADVLSAAETPASLDQALIGATTVVGLSARTGKHRKPHWRFDGFADELARLSVAGEIALVFGREDHGLTDRELDRCTHLVHLPTAGLYTSFNLSQAVLLAAYELHRGLLREPAPPAGDPPANQESREAMFAHLQEALHTIGYLHEDSVEPIMRRLRRLLGRAETSEDEVRLLRGLARQTLWAADQAGLPRRSPQSPQDPADEG